MAEDWTLEEVAATVTDYFEMLARELRGESYNKKERNRNLQQVLSGRSAGAIEFKHANISAVLHELGYPCIDGYKPRANYQALLGEFVAARLASDAHLAAAAELAVAAPALEAPTLRPLGEVMVMPPVRENVGAHSYERRVGPPLPQLGVNYLERESRNASLGSAGEMFVLQIEHQRLWEAGHRQLAERIEHVSRTQGDGLGYDVVSFETNGSERLIEVKTTSFGSMTPFFASKREVVVSEDRAVQYNLYRVFRFRELPKVFVLAGSLRASCLLDPIQYRASLP